MRLRVIATLRKTYQNMDRANRADVIARVFNNLDNMVQWVDENGGHIATDEPVLRDALMSEMQSILRAPQTYSAVGVAGAA